jgi:hypothetical protein
LHAISDLIGMNVQRPTLLRKTTAGRTSNSELIREQAPN